MESSAGGAGEAGGTTRRVRRIQLRLYVNGVSYQHNRKCAFCEEKVATKHCPFERCGFVCDSCDEYRHSNPLNVAYQAHKRAKVSRLTLEQAGAKVQGFMRFVHLRRLMREEVRRVWDRFYDSKKRRHFYYHKFTRQVSWTKPRLLGREELRPFLTPNEAAFKMQQLYRNFRAREVAREHLRSQWERIYDPNAGNFYYFYGGCSPLVEEQTRWSQPCKCMGREWIWRPLLTEALAALRIYRMWEAARGRRYIRNIVRQLYIQRRDPVTGAYVYTNKRTGMTRLDKPVLLGSERWDPENVMDWTTEEVVIFLRRCGLKEHTSTFRRFDVDGALLLTFDPEDLQLMGMTNSLHIKKILLALERRPAFQGYNEDPKDLMRRAALRQRYAREEHAVCVQRAWRSYLGAKIREQMKATIRERLKANQRERKREESLVWWSQRGGGYTGRTPGTKDFGSHAIREWARGWGRYDVNGSWMPAHTGYGAHQSHVSHLIVRNTDMQGAKQLAMPARPSYDVATDSKEASNKVHTMRQYFF
jgi:hypothetical protein